jgi:TonB family protein
MRFSSVPRSLLSVGLIIGLAAPAAAEVEDADDRESILLERRAIEQVPTVNPAWQAPRLPVGSQPAVEIGSLEARRDHEIDYPREARIGLAEGSARVGFTIDETGRVDDCVVIRSSGNVYLDTGSCALVVARGLYRPALDAEGRAIRSGHSREVAWNLDWDRIQPATERLVRLSYVVRTDGTFGDCWLDRGAGTYGVSHIEMCMGTWPEHILEYLHRIGGPGDLHIQLITGYALSEDAMERQMATIPGWIRYNGDAAWHMLQADGTASRCIDVAFPGGTLWEDDACRVTNKRFAVSTNPEGRATPDRIGIHFSWFVAEPLEPNHILAANLP